MSILAILATITGISVGLANLPQALKIFKNKSAKDISIITYLIIEIGVIVWILYGLELKSFPIVIPNILSLIMTTLVLAGYFLYGRVNR